MNRIRQIYQSDALYVGSGLAQNQHYSSGNSGINLIKQLNRVQSANFDYSVQRTEVNQFGQLDAIDRPSLSTPSAPLTFSYLLANMYNEKQLGFNVGDGVTCISGILAKVTDGKNYFLKVVAEGQDANGVVASTTLGHTMAIGNGFITSYSVSADVGSFPTVNIGVEGLNWVVDSGTSGNNIPAIDPSNGAPITQYTYGLPIATSNPGTGDLAISVIRPGDISLTIKEAGTNIDIEEVGLNINDAKIQSFTLSFDLAREAIQKLGSRFAIAREITFPVNINMGIEAIVGELTSGSLDELLCNDTDYDITVNLREPSCTGGGDIVAQYLLRKAKIDSVSYANSIGGNATASLNFVSTLGGPSSVGGLFLSGVYSN